MPKEQRPKYGTLPEPPRTIEHGGRTWAVERYPTNGGEEFRFGIHFELLPGRRLVDRNTVFIGPFFYLRDFTDAQLQAMLADEIAKRSAGPEEL